MKKITFLLSIIFLWASHLGAQSLISGYITDQITLQPLSQVNVVLEGSDQGATTDDAGRFQFLTQHIGPSTLKISHIGYRIYTKEIHMNTNDTIIIDCKLRPAINILKETSITASRWAKNIEDIPASIDNISAEELKILPGTNTDNLLQAIPNVYVNRSWGIFSKNSSVTMRGMDGTSRVLVLYNGVPLNKTAGGGINWHLINPDQIERIEIIKGPASAMYGNNAMAGVINIISKTQKEKLNGSVSTFYGTYNTLGSRVNLSGNSIDNGKGFYWNAESFYRQGDGYIIEPYERRDSTDVPLYLKEFSSNMKLGYQFNPKTKVEIEYQFYTDKRGDGIKIYEQEGGYMQYPTNYIRAKYQSHWKGLKIQTHAFYHKQDYIQHSERLNQTGDTYKLYDRTNNTQDYGFWLSTEKKWNENHSLIAGIDTKQGSIDASEVYRTSSDELYMLGKINFAALFLQDEFKYKNLSLQSGIRFDYAGFNNGSLTVKRPTSITAFEGEVYEELPSTNWTNISPRLAVLYPFNEQTRLYASVSCGFMPPKLDDMCSSRKISKGFKIANPNLKPETMITYEIGAHLKPLDRLHIDWAAYYNDGHDFQYFIGTGDTIDYDRPVLQRTNISRVGIIGSEISLNYQIIKNLQFTTNYSYNHSMIQDFDMEGYYGEDLTNKQISETPPHQYYIGLMYNHKKFSTAISYNSVSAMWSDEQNTLKLEPYATLDLRIAVHPVKHLSLVLDIQNLLDKIYVDKKGGLAPGRYILGKVVWDF
ncbi:MAG: TonB-dependent receptor [Bacteroidales bacterium]|nr:TonB-dependent receptor [Bacteroidales bacterium]